MWDGINIMIILRMINMIKARIIQIAWSYIHNFSTEKLSTAKIECYVRKPLILQKFRQKRSTHTEYYRICQE